MQNQLWNEHGRAGESNRSLYQEFFDKFSEHRFLTNGNKWRAMKLLSDQYVDARGEFFAIKDPNGLRVWLLENQHRLFNIPMVHAFNDGPSQRKPSRFLDFQIVNMGPVVVDTKFYHHQTIEEVVQGPGYEGDLRVYIPYNPLRYDDTALKMALASFGIYINDMVYENDDSGRFLDCRFAMLQRDWSFTIDWAVWMPDVQHKIRRLELDEDDEPDFDNMTQLERHRYLAARRAEEIENGWDPIND